jgi:hypothetical protein
MAKSKFPGCQKIHSSKKWGFTKFNGGEFEDMVAEKRLIPDGCGIKHIPNSGPLDKRWNLQLLRAPHYAVPSLVTLIMFTNKSSCPPKKRSDPVPVRA